MDDETPARAAKESGATAEHTVDAGIEHRLDDPYAVGVGPDIVDAEIMRRARR
jgi:hypothetical protein